MPIMPFLRLSLSLSALGLLAACAALPAQPSQAQQLDTALKGRPLVLLGEVHDNAGIHQARFEAIQRAVQQGWRPAIAMEQFDYERQALIDEARKQRPGDADYLIQQAAPVKNSWNWTFYRPVIALALQYDLPIVAANLSRADASKVVKLGYGGALPEALISRVGLDRPVPADIVAGQREAIDKGHCGQLPATVLDGMVKAQIARDVIMAEVLRPYIDRGAVLLAGNGHVRRDIGVPRWLPGSVSVGLLEQADAKAYDLDQVYPAATRPDPCAAFGKTASAS